MNPIYLEYYCHEDCDCYKIDLPWTKYAKDTQVLCREEQGIAYARTIAMGLICQHFLEACGL